MRKKAFEIGKTDAVLTSIFACLFFMLVVSLVLTVPKEAAYAALASLIALFVVRVVTLAAYSTEKHQ